MILYFIENIGTIIAVAALLIFVTGIIYTLVKDRKAGKCSCGNTCGSCPMGEQCHSITESKKAAKVSKGKCCH